MMSRVRTRLMVYWAALTLSIMGCEEKGPVGPPPAIPLRPSDVPPAQGPRRGPPSPAPSQEPQRPRNPWSQPRVGDVLEYDYSYTSGGRFDPEATLRATLTLEVVALESPWVWVKVTVKRKEPDPNERSFLVPVNREQQPPPDPTARRSPGKPSKASVGETSLACEEGHVDASEADGPVSSWCDSTDPLMYLGRRIWEKSTVMGPGGYSRTALEATRVLRGAEAAAARPLPTGIPRLFAPAVWYRRLPISARAGASGGEFQEFFVGGWGARKWRSLSRILRTAEDLKRTDLVMDRELWRAGAEGVREGSLGASLRWTPLGSAQRALDRCPGPPGPGRGGEALGLERRAARSLHRAGRGHARYAQPEGAPGVRVRDGPEVSVRPPPRGGSEEETRRLFVPARADAPDQA
jgi:hypothetical protein